MLQSRLLRVLQEREVRRVGDNTPIFVNVRVVAATNEPLEQRIKEGTFREDLYYRLNVISIQLPPLRERLDDIPLLIAHFLQNKGGSRNGREFKVTQRAMETLCAYDWPGNVRELENAIERAVTLCEDNLVSVRDLPPSLLRKINVSDPGDQERKDMASLPETVAFPLKSSAGDSKFQTPSGPALDETKPLKIFIRDQEIAYLNRTLEQCGGDKERAAIQLGVSLATLYRKLSGDERES
jgi:DNA-binding NtrC family response regulator